MIRKMLVIAAAVAMPAATMAGITAVAGSGIASAKALPPITGTCSLAGTVTFAKPGLTGKGYVINKTVEDTATAITPTGGAQCGAKAIKSKIPAATTACWATLPVYNKTNPVGGVLAAGAASSCDIGGSSAQGDANINATDVKTAIKDKYYYDTVGSLANGPADILTALAGGVKTKDNGTNIVLMPTAAAQVLPGGACGASEAGFSVSGTVTGGSPAVSSFTMDICLGTDSGTGTTGNFLADVAVGTSTIAVANLDATTSSLVLS